MNKNTNNTGARAARRRQREDTNIDAADDDAWCESASEDSECVDWRELDEVREEVEEMDVHEETRSRVPAELRNNDVVPQEYDAYMSSHSSTHHVSGKIDLTKEIDPIDGRLVAKFRVEELFRRIRTNAFSQRKNFERAMTILEGKSLNCLLAGKSEVQEARRKRRIAESPRPIQPMVSAALRYLMHSARFLIGTRLPKKALPSGRPIVSHCGAFFVRKSNGKLRVILDGRYANVYFKPSATSFAFFKYETLRNVVDNLSAKNEWYALNYDLRHWFHQIPLPRFYLSLIHI